MAGGGSVADIASRHLLRFAFREDLQIDWRPLPG
jgi:hypothetical protein